MQEAKLIAEKKYEEEATRQKKEITAQNYLDKMFATRDRW